MTRGEPRDTREKLIDGGLRLFAERGYRGTSVGDIEEAAGLTPRAGGLYRHFASKRELLEAAIERHVTHTQALFEVLDLMPTGDPRAEIVLLARWALREFREKDDLMRVLMRDGDEIPDLRSKYYDQIVRRGYETVIEWMKRHFKQEGLPDIDFEGVAAVTVGSLVHYHFEKSVFGFAPADVDEERLVQALATLCYGFFEKIRAEHAAELNSSD
jgi:AcrR family transcriptional regulator